MTRQLAECGIPLNRPICLQRPLSSERYLLDMAEEICSHGRPEALIVRNLFQSWLLDIARESKVAPGEGLPPNLQQALLRIQKSPDHRLCLKTLARECSISVPHLCRLFKQFLGTSPIDYLINERMWLAEEMLHNPAMSVAEITRRTGYDNPAYFSRLFRKHFGLSPNQISGRQTY